MASRESTESVCSFPLSRMYIRDNEKMFSPMGFTECVNATNETNPLCLDCSCRELQFVRDGGSLISWGNCIPGANATACQTPQVYCNTTSDPSSPSGSSSKTTGPVASRSIATASPTPTTSATPASAVDSGSSTPTALIVIAVLSVLLAVAAFAFAFIRLRRKRDQAFSTPRQTGTSYVTTVPPLKVSTPQFGSNNRRPSQSRKRAKPPSLSASDLSSSEVRDTLATDDFVSMVSSNGTRYVGDVNGRPGDGGENPRLQSSFVSDLYTDTMRSMAVDDDVPSPQDEVTGRSPFTIGEDSEEEDRIAVHFGLTATTAFSSAYWDRASDDGALNSSRSSGTSFFEDLSPREAVSV